jgi:hypothetical protein
VRHLAAHFSMNSNCLRTMRHPSDCCPARPPRRRRTSCTNRANMQCLPPLLRCLLRAQRDLRIRAFRQRTSSSFLRGPFIHCRHGHRDATIILLAFRHGLRAAELCDLRWDQIEFSAAVLHVRRVKNGTAVGCLLPPNRAVASSCRISTTRSSRSRTAVSSSCAFIMKPPSPHAASTRLCGWALYLASRFGARIS